MSKKHHYEFSLASRHGSICIVYKYDSNDVKHPPPPPTPITQFHKMQLIIVVAKRVPAALGYLLQQMLQTVPWLQLEWAAAKEVLTAHDMIQILLTITNSADCQHSLHTIVYTDLLTIPSTRMKSSYLKWDMSIPNKYGLTFCWTSWNKVWRRSHQRNHWPIPSP